MALLIDGYNLLHGTDLFGRGRDAGTLEASREALLGFVMATLEGPELSQTTIVFDSKEAPPGLPRSYRRDGLSIRFATGYADADELLEELIAADNAPKKLTVVSSDHRVQRAARRRRARTVDSHQWYFEMRQRAARPGSAAHDAKPEGPFSTEEVAAYVRQFRLPPELEQEAREALPPPVPDSEPRETALRIEPAESTSHKPVKRRRGRRRRKSVEPNEKRIDLANPFPPGYAEDVLAEEGE